MMAYIRPPLTVLIIIAIIELAGVSYAGAQGTPPIVHSSLEIGPIIGRTSPYPEGATLLLTCQSTAGTPSWFFDDSLSEDFMTTDEGKAVYTIKYLDETHDKMKLTCKVPRSESSTTVVLQVLTIPTLKLSWMPGLVPVGAEKLPNSIVFFGTNSDEEMTCNAMGRVSELLDLCWVVVPEGATQEINVCKNTKTLFFDLTPEYGKKFSLRCEVRFEDMKDLSKINEDVKKKFEENMKEAAVGLNATIDETKSDLRVISSLEVVPLSSGETAPYPEGSDVQLICESSDSEHAPYWSISNELLKTATEKDDATIRATYMIESLNSSLHDGVELECRKHDSKDYRTITLNVPEIPQTIVRYHDGNNFVDVIDGDVEMTERTIEASSNKTKLSCEAQHSGNKLELCWVFERGAACKETSVLRMNWDFEENDYLHVSCRILLKDDTVLTRLTSDAKDTLKWHLQGAWTVVHGYFPNIQPSTRTLPQLTVFHYTKHLTTTTTSTTTTTTREKQQDILVTAPITERPLHNSTSNPPEPESDFGDTLVIFLIVTIVLVIALIIALTCIIVLYRKVINMRTEADYNLSSAQARYRRPNRNDFYDPVLLNEGTDV